MHEHARRTDAPISIPADPAGEVAAPGERRQRVWIGTGGPLVRTPDPEAILAAALFDPAAPTSLRPRAPRLLVDRDYLLYAIGLIAQVDRDAAAALGHASLSPPSQEYRHGRTRGP